MEPAPSPRHWKKAALAGAIALLAATAFHLVPFLGNHSHFDPDSSLYFKLAEHLARDGHFSRDGVTAETFRTPGYPWIMSMFLKGDSLNSLIIWQHGMVLATASIVFAIGFSITGSWLLSMVAGLIIAFDLPSLFVAHQFLTDVPFMLLMAAMIGFLVWGSRYERPWLWVIAGLFLGTATLIRPVSLYLSIVLAALIAAGLAGALSSRRKQLVWACGFLIAALALPTAWISRNKDQADFPGLSTVSNLTLLYFTAAGSIAIKNPGSYYDNVMAEQPKLSERLYGDQRRADIYDNEESRIWHAERGHLAKQVIFENLDGFVLSSARSFANLMFGGGAASLSRFFDIPTKLARPLTSGWALLLFLMAMVGAVALWRAHREAALLFTIVTLYFVGITTVTGIGWSRYRLPMMPTFALLAATGAVWLGFRLRQRAARRMTLIEDSQNTSADPCWVCDGTSFTPFKPSNLPSAVGADNFRISDANYGVTGELVKCRSCGFIQATDLNDVVSHYENLEDPDYEATRLERATQAERLLQRIRPMTPQGASLLDVGAGSGILVDQAQRMGFAAEGIEPSRWLAKQAQERGLPVTNGILPHATVKGPFDVVIVNDVIEHVTKPRELLSAVQEVIAPNGVLLTVTPDVSSVLARLLKHRWWHFRIAHVGYFNLRTLDQILSTSGFEKVSVFRPCWYFPIYYLWERLRAYPPFLRLKLPERIGRTMVPLNLFDSLAGIYRSTTK